MQFVKYFEKNTSIERKCNTKGILYFDNTVRNIFNNNNNSNNNKTYGEVTRTSLENSLMSSYKNRNATLYNVIVTANGRLYQNNKKIGEIIGCWSEKTKDDRLLDSTLYDYVISISGVWTYGIWHFPTEALTALMKHKIAENVKIHVHTKTPYVLYWLSLIGINEDQVIHRNIRAKQLFIPELGAAGSPYAEQIDWLSELVRKSVIKKKEKLLILVKRTRTRPILNYNMVYAECLKLASIMNLTLYIHDDDNLPSIKNQHAAFKSAKVLVAPHGGGNVNMVAMDEGTSFIEITDDKHSNICFLRVALYKNINYYGVGSKNWNADIKSLIYVFKKISNTT